MSAVSPDGVSFEDWVGRSHERTDALTTRLAAEFEATFAPNLAKIPGAPLGLFWTLAPDIEPAVKVVASAFTGERLFSDFSATLKSNGLIDNKEVRVLSGLSHFIILYAAICMHQCIIVVDESFTMSLSTFAHPAGFIQVDCPIAVKTGMINVPTIALSSAIFSTSLKSDEYCEPSLRLTPGPWDFPLELTGSGRIKRLQ
jgi:hypothetical protein